MPPIMEIMPQIRTKITQNNRRSWNIPASMTKLTNTPIAPKTILNIPAVVGFHVLTGLF